MTSIAIVGAGSVGTALGNGFTAHGHAVTYGVRNPADARYATLPNVAPMSAAVSGADVVILAVPCVAVPDVLRAVSLHAGQTVIDATNAVRTPVPEGFATMGDLVASLVPDGVAVVKAFNTIGAEHLATGTVGGKRAFLPVAGDDSGAQLAATLGTELGFESVVVGGRDQFATIEHFAKLWIQLAFGCGIGRGFGFGILRP